MPAKRNMKAKLPSKPRRDTVALDNSSVSKRPAILRLSQEILDEIAFFVALGGYQAEYCPQSWFAQEEWIEKLPGRGYLGPTSATKVGFARYEAAKRSLLSMMLSCKRLSESARRLVYQHVVISRPEQLAPFLRTLVLRPDAKKRIKHVEFSCKLESWEGKDRDLKSLYGAWIDVATTESFPWLERLIKHWGSRKRTYERVVAFLYLALLYSTPAVKTLCLSFRTPKTSYNVYMPQSRPLIMKELEDFAKSHVVCPQLEQVCLCTDGRLVSLEYFQPLLSLGNVTKLTLHDSGLSLAPHLVHESAAAAHNIGGERNVLQNIEELTLDDFDLSTVPGSSPSTYHFPYDIFVRAKKVRVLRFGALWASKKGWLYTHDVICRGIINLFRFPSLAALESVDIDMSGTELSQFMRRFERIMRCRPITSLRVPIKELVGDFGWMGKGHPVYDTPQTFINRIVVPNNNIRRPFMLPSRLTKLILVLTEGGRPKSCGTFELSQWEPLDHPVTGGRRWPRVQLCKVLSECAPWLEKVDVCVVKGRCTLH